MSYVSGFMIGASIGKSIHQFFDNDSKTRAAAARRARYSQTVRRQVPAIPLFSCTAKSTGRRRYYAAGLRNNQALANLLAQSIYKLSGIRHVEVNPRTGSLLLLGDEKTLNTVEQVLSERVFLSQLPGGELMQELDDAKAMEKQVESDFRHTASDVGQMFSQAVLGSTGNILDLRSLVALLFIVRGLRKVVLYDQRASGPQLLWWALSLLRGK